MKIIISPAKKMNVVADILPYEKLPVLIEKTEILKQKLQILSRSELKTLLMCNEQIASLNYERYQRMNLQRGLSPAILSYEGIQYRYMAPIVFTDQELIYIQKHLRILSGFYGILKPMDGVVPYRLEMQAKLSVEGTKNLYEYWGRTIYDTLIEEDGDKETVIINLASKEYSKIIESYLTPDIRYINCIFGKMVDKKIKTSGTYAKMARGEMVRFMAENQITESNDWKRLCKFDRLGYRFENALSSENRLVFLQP